MESQLHKDLKYKATSYLFDKGHWVSRPEVNCGYYGIYDAWGITSKLTTMGIEVKVSVSDFKNNKSKEAKSASGYVVANENYILCPEGLLQPEDMDPNYGLLWFKDGRLLNKKKPKFLEMDDKQKLRIVMSIMCSTANQNHIVYKPDDYPKN